MKRETLDRLNEAREAGRAVVLATSLTSGDTRMIDAEAGADYDFCGADIENDVLAALCNNRSAIVETPDGSFALLLSHLWTEHTWTGPEITAWCRKKSDSILKE